MQATSPSSSTTTPSPPLSFLHPPDAPDTLQLAHLEPHEREERQRAVQKLLERAECSKLTRGLRARLAYASYKAANNLSHVPLPVLEDRIHDALPSPAPSPSPLPPPPSTPNSPAHKRRAAMAPPLSPSRSLYAALLGPPPSKRPRHVYGPPSVSGPAPTPADLLPSYSPATPRKPPPSPQRSGAQPSSPFASGGQGRTVRTVLQGRARSTVTEKEDMNAAATLTALMFNRASPRQQRCEDGGVRTTTPAPSSKVTEDADAAELMLYLATSPSPARPTVARRAPGSMGRVLFACAGAGRPDGDGLTEGSRTPALTAGQSSIPSSQETNATGTQLLPPPPSPSLALARSAGVGGTPVGGGKKGGGGGPFEVSRRLFVESEEAHRREGAGAGAAGAAGAAAGAAARFGLGKGIDLVEAK